ncbi:MAG: ribosome maturation factor RimM [Gammaproteobacteria bacterium]
MTPEPDAWVVLGRITGVYGVRGWLRIFSHTDPREGILSYPVWWLGEAGSRREQALAEGRAHGHGVVARFDGIADRDQALALIGNDIAVPRSVLAEDEGYYWTDLVGLAVRNLDGVDLGCISGHIDTGAHDVMVVKDGSHERLIPWALERTVIEVNADEGWVQVDWHPED